MLLNSALHKLQDKREEKEMKRRFAKWMALCLAVVLFVGAVPHAAVNAAEQSEWVVYQKGEEDRFSSGGTVLSATDDGLCATVPAGQYLQFTAASLNIDLPRGMAADSFKFCVRVYIPDEVSRTLFTEGGGQFELFNTQFDADEISWNTSAVAQRHAPTVGWNTLELSFADADGRSIDVTKTITGFRFYAGVDALKDQVRSLTFGEMKIQKRVDAATCSHETVANGAEITPSTCTEAGEAQAVCTLCGTVTGTRPLPLAECRWDDGKVTARPTMDAVGVREFTCLVCNKVKFEEEPVLTGLGDVNGDRKIDSTDARMTLQYAVKKIGEDALNTEAADVDNSEAVDSTDARLILQYAVGKIDELPAERTWQKPALDGDWDDDGTLKILTVGNSFSDDSMQYVYGIAKDVGVENIKLGNLYIGGCTLDTHAANARGDRGAYEYRTNSTGTWKTVGGYKMSDAIKSEDWDFISLQQASGSSGMANTYANLPYLIEYVQTLCPTAKIVWNMTWAYAQNSTHNEFYKYSNNQLTMYNAIVDAVEKKVETESAIYTVIPTGTAIQNARTSYVGDTLTRDGFHLSYDFGRYVAGVTFVHKLTGLPVSALQYMPQGVEEDLRKIAVEAATNAVATPKEVTPSTYQKAPVIDMSGYTKLELSWTPLGYWNSTDGTKHHTVITTADNSKLFYASATFTRDELPVGSVIELKSGWQYRPEGWKSSGAQTSRPENVTTSKVVITEAWWGDYTHRAFNLSKVGTTSLENAANEIETALIVWIPEA